jgi:hypothetical protein
MTLCAASDAGLQQNFADPHSQNRESSMAGPCFSRFAAAALAGLCLQCMAAGALAQAVPAADASTDRATALAQTLIVNARVFDGRSDRLAEGMSVLVAGNKIAQVSRTAIVPAAGTRVIDAAGRTLMPGLIDAQTHLMFATVPQM